MTARHPPDLPCDVAGVFAASFENLGPVGCGPPPRFCWTGETVPEREPAARALHGPVGAPALRAVSLCSNLRRGPSRPKTVEFGRLSASCARRSVHRR